MPGRTSTGPLVPFACAVSSVGEHHIDTVGVASSILAPRTISKARGYGLFLWARGSSKAAHRTRLQPRKGSENALFGGPTMSPR